MKTMWCSGTGGQFHCWIHVIELRCSWSVHWWRKIRLQYSVIPHTPQNTRPCVNVNHKDCKKNLNGAFARTFFFCLWNFRLKSVWFVPRKLQERCSSLVATWLPVKVCLLVASLFIAVHVLYNTSPFDSSSWIKLSRKVVQIRTTFLLEPDRGHAYLRKRSNPTTSYHTVNPLLSPSPPLPSSRQIRPLSPISPPFSGEES